MNTLKEPLVTASMIRAGKKISKASCLVNQDFYNDEVYNAMYAASLSPWKSALKIRPKLEHEYLIRMVYSYQPGDLTICSPEVGEFVENDDILMFGPRNQGKIKIDFNSKDEIHDIQYADVIPE